MDSAGGALTTALVGAGVGYTLGTGTTGQHVHLYHPLTPGTGTTGIPIRVTDSFYPTHMMTLRGVGRPGNNSSLSVILSHTAKTFCESAGIFDFVIRIRDVIPKLLDSQFIYFCS